MAKIETGKLAGQLGWYVFWNGLLDCDVPASKTEYGAVRRACKEYGLSPSQIVTTKHPEHYSNRK